MYFSTMQHFPMAASLNLVRVTAPHTPSKCGTGVICVHTHPAAQETFYCLPFRSQLMVFMLTSVCFGG